MDSSRDRLLQPSLRDTAVAKAPYSVQAVFLTSFFGGPLAAIAITAVNSVRLQRWGRDLLPLGAVLILYIGFVLILARTGWGAGFRISLHEFAGERGIAYLHRFIALVLAGLGYLLHAKEQRGASVMGMDRPNGWIGGLACAIGGALLLAGLQLILINGARP